MLVKIGTHAYNSSQEPIMLLLSLDEQMNITSSPSNEHGIAFCAYPQGMDAEDIRQWMATAPEPTPPKPVKRSRRNRRKCTRRKAKR